MQQLPPDLASLLMARPAAPAFGLAGPAPALPEEPGPLLPPPAAARPVISELDRWAQKNYEKGADQLEPDELAELRAYVRKLAEQDRQHWQARNDRIERDEDARALTLPEYEAGGLEQAQNAEIVVSPLPYLITDKLTNMLASAQWPVDVPSHTAQGAAQAQQVENFCAWWIREAAVRHQRAGGSQLYRDMADHNVVAGWICGLVMPNSSDPAFPWRFELAPPTEVYPLFSHDGLERVTWQYCMMAVEARRAFPEAEEMLSGYQDDEPVWCVSYYDRVYRMILLENDREDRPEGTTVQRPVAHGVLDIFGNPETPWVIVLPKGKGMRGARHASRGRWNDTATVGVGALYAMHDTYAQLNKIASQLATNVARSANPPIVQYLQPGEEPREITFEPGGRSYLLFQRNHMEILDTAPNPANMQPLVSMLQDWLNKATLPGVFWGDAGAVTSGFGVGLLTNAARDVLLPYVEGMRSFLRLLYRKVLEVYLSVLADTVGPVAFTSFSPETGRRLGGAVLEPAVVAEVGVDVDVDFVDLTPQDQAGAVQRETLAVQSRFHSRETAMRETGVRDVELEKARIDLDAVLADPMVASQMGLLTLQHPSMSTFEKLLAAQQLKAQALQQAQQVGPQGTGPGSALPGHLPAQTLPPPMQAGAGAGLPPPQQNPNAQGQAAANDIMARLSGGTPPAP